MWILPSSGDCTHNNGLALHEGVCCAVYAEQAVNLTTTTYTYVFQGHLPSGEVLSGLTGLKVLDIREHHISGVSGLRLLQRNTNGNKNCRCNVPCHSIVLYAALAVVVSNRHDHIICHDNNMTMSYATTCAKHLASARCVWRPCIWQLRVWGALIASAILQWARGCTNNIPVCLWRRWR